MYITTGQGQAIPGDKILMSTETSCHFGHLLQVSKTSLWNLILYNFLYHDFIHVCTHGAGTDNPLGTTFWCPWENLVTSVISCKFQENSIKSDFIQFFHFIHVYSPRTGTDTPQGTKFWCQRKVLWLHSFVASLKKMSLKPNFIDCFHELIHVYSPGAGADSPQRTKNWCQQKGLIILPICCKFQKNLFEVWFNTSFFMI